MRSAKCGISNGGLEYNKGSDCRYWLFVPQSANRDLKSEILRVGGIVLAGGKSSRMGRAKATLPFGAELMVQRAVRLLGSVVQPIVVVAAAGQELPELPAHTLIAYDEREARGPLEGLLAGLTLIEPLADAIYATSCDVPLLEPAFVQAVIERLGDAQIAVPVEDDFAHPLAAVYRTSVVPTVRELLSADQLRPAFLFDRVPTRRIPVEELRQFDANFATLRNCNRPEDYEAALAEAGFEPLGET
ncbi:MAG TPA: molybdenum cofactor guanylyltransferase [Pirellulaceae bacterium]|jgi:molybdopterin-guanine dinucleotide biosynthesis protein A